VSVLIPLSAVPSQSLSVLLGGQNCQINVYSKSTGLYIDLAVDNAPIMQCQLCVDRVQMAGRQYLDFVGYLEFVDTLGTSNPVYTGLGGQYVLVYGP